MEFDQLSVYQQLVTPDLNCTETHTLLHAAALDLEIQVIEFRSLIAPLYRRKVPEGKFRSFPLRPDGLLLMDSAAFQGECHFPVLEKIRSCSREPGPADLSGDDIHIPEIIAFGYPQKNVPEYAVVTEHVLVFKICSVAPSANHNDYLIYPVMEIRSHIEFRSVVRAFRISDIMFVHIYVRAACYPQER